MTIASQVKGPMTAEKLQRTLFIFLPLFMLINVLMMSHYWIFTNSARSQLEESQRLGVELSRNVVIDNLVRVVAEVNYLTDYLQQHHLNALKGSVSTYRANQFLYTFADHRRWYDHIRYLDLDGNEVVRINNRNEPQILARSELQNKAERYYFAELQSLGPGQVYISPLDLNIEGDQVETPFKPTIRVGQALYNAQGDKQGYILINYLGNQIIDDFKRVSWHISDQMMLVNNQGFWLINPDEDRNWGFILEHHKSFTLSYPGEWHTIEQLASGQFESVQGLFTFTTVYPYSEEMKTQLLQLTAETQEYFWKVISFAPRQKLQQSRYDFLKSNGPTYSFTLLLILISSLIISKVRQRHEAVLIQNTYESSFRRVLEDIQMAAVILDRRGRIIFCNDYLLSLTGYQRNELLNQHWIDLLPDNDSTPSDYSRYLAKLAHDDQHHSSEGYLRCKNKEQRLLAWTHTYSLEDGEEISSVTLLGRDITEQRDIEQQLIKLSQAVEQSPNTVMITNARGDIEYVNPKFTQLTGYSREEVLGKKPSVLKSGQTDPEEYQQLWSTIGQGKTWQGTLKNKKKNGEYYWEKTIISPIMDSDNRIRHFLSLKEDITERVLLQREVERQTEETRKNRELTAVGQMANMIAHDLRNPLSSIKMALQILNRERVRSTDGGSEQAVELISISQDQVRYMEAILSDLMSYSRPDRLKPEWLRLDKLMQTTILSHLKDIQSARVDVVERYQKGLPTLYGDPVKLRQVFSNLLINAIHAVKGVESPQITVSMDLLISDAGPKIKICVSDNGSGIDPCQATMVFEPFYTSKAKGTGLGLAIVKQYVEQHRGNIKLEPLNPNGTQARLILPINPPGG